MSDTLRDCPAPAKLNLFLHITGRRADGYHELQTVFQLIDWADTLHFRRRADGRIVHETPLPGVPPESDLTVRAARLLQTHTGTGFGVDIAIEKRLPQGAGLGGGSSDAATTLLALNRLWQLDLPRAELARLGLQLGADVPFFVFGRNAFAEGLGERLQAVDLPQRYFLVVTPPVQVPTVEIFNDPRLTRNTKSITITDFLGHGNYDVFGRNDMQPVATEKYPEVAAVLEWFKPFGAARMTGSGASVFAAFGDRVQAQEAYSRLPEHWQGRICTSLDRHPLFDFAS